MRREVCHGVRLRHESREAAGQHVPERRSGREGPAQFDVYRNLGSRCSDTPFVVAVPSSIFDDTGRREEIPLLIKAAAPSRLTSLNPIVEVEGIEVVLHPLQIVSVPLDRLGPVVSSLASDGDRIIAAIGLVISHAWN